MFIKKVVKRSFKLRVMQKFGRIIAPLELNTQSLNSLNAI